MLAGPKARHDFPDVGHVPYWKRYAADWEQQTRAFLSRYTRHEMECEKAVGYDPAPYFVMGISL